MKSVHALHKRLTLAQQLLRCGVGVAVLMVACCGGVRPRTTESTAESPVESTEVAVECLSRTRVSDPRESVGRSEASVHFCSRATNPYSPSHSLLASPGKGHRLPNGLSAPLRC